MIEHQDEIAGFNKSEALLLLFPYIYKEQESNEMDSTATLIQ